MAPRWIGLACPQPKKNARRNKRKTKRNLHHHPIDGTLRAFGAACVLGGALFFNWALFPDAFGQTTNMWDRHIAMFAPEGAPALAPAETTAALSAPLPVSEEEVHLLAATAWGEARSEGEDGMRAVAHVMVNRVGERFGDNLETVILAPKQFSVWNAGDPNRPLVRNPERYARSGENRETWEVAQQVAREVLSGQSADPTNGALFYHTRAIRPWWSRYGEGRQEIGAHVFYRDVPAQFRAEHPRVTRTAARAPAAEQQGRRAGRVNGVIQYAPSQTAAASADAPLTRTAPDPAMEAAVAQLPTSSSLY
jgi:spore germination cell wall hydrolase CwlJ-like protein